MTTYKNGRTAATICIDGFVHQTAQSTARTSSFDENKQPASPVQQEYSSRKKYFVAANVSVLRSCFSLYFGAQQKDTTA